VEKILYVERELGRCFCCEDCIRDYFQPNVEFMEEEFRRLRPASDFSERECARLSHYRQLTLEDPDEIWDEQSDTGEHHYTYIARFSSGDLRLSYVVVCLAIEHVPSFVFLSFPSRDEDLVDEYRRGAELKGSSQAHDEPAVSSVAPASDPHEDPASTNAPENLDDPELSAFERLYLQARQTGDIPREQFTRFEAYVEPTLDEADEIWRFVDPEGNEWCTFIARHTMTGEAEDAGDALDEFTMIVICEPSHDGAARGLDVLFAFPTIDPGLVQHFRKGINSLNKAFGVGWTWGRAA